MSKPQLAGYIGIQKDEKGSVKRFFYGRDLEQIRRLGAEPDSDTHAEKREITEVEKDVEGEPFLLRAMNRVIETADSQNDLLAIVASLKPAFLKLALEKEVVDPVAKQGKLIDRIEGVEIFEVSDEVLRQLWTTKGRLDRVNGGLAALPSALLMSIVATFDSNIADVIRDMLAYRIETFASDKSIPLSEILKADSLEALRERAIADEIYQFLRGSHDDQVQYIERVFHIAIRKPWKRWPDFMEVFERRNLIAHGEKTFTRRYVSICSEHGHRGSEKTLGTSIKVTFRYLRQAADLLLEFSILLIFSLWRKQIPSQEADAFARLNDASYRLIRRRRYLVAVRILDYAMSLKNTKESDAVRKMMVVNLASAYKHSKDSDSCMKTLNSIDWSGSGLSYRLSVAALKEDHPEVGRLLVSAVKAENLSRTEFFAWPVFDFVREHETVVAACREVFGDDIGASGEAKSLDLPLADPSGSDSASSSII